jgi:2-hydroxychromene-2-carboxylate isomerase
MAWVRVGQLRAGLWQPAPLGHNGGMPAAPVFYFGAMSPYSWLAAERLGDLLPGAVWRCVYLPAIFSARGRTTWGFTERREAEMAECEARARARGLGAIRWPADWPTSDLLAARAITHAERKGVLEPVALELMRAAFLRGEDIAEVPAVLAACRRAGLDGDALESALTAPEVKDGLREHTDEALAAGVSGVPTVAVGGELYWGDDRLEDAAKAAGTA